MPSSPTVECQRMKAAMPVAARNARLRREAFGKLAHQSRKPAGRRKVMKEKDRNTGREVAENTAANGKEMRNAMNMIPPKTIQIPAARERTIRIQLWRWIGACGATNIFASVLNMGAAFVILVWDSVLALIPPVPGGLLFVLGTAGAVLTVGPLTGGLLRFSCREWAKVRGSGL